MNRTRLRAAVAALAAVVAAGPVVLTSVDAQAPGRVGTGAARPVSTPPVTIAPTSPVPLQEYRIGPEDVLDITV